MKGGQELKYFQEKFLYITVFLTGAVVLVIEILGTRILAPFYGSTIFVWSSLIAVTLGFLSLGYWLGGKLADMWHSGKELFLIIISAGLVFAATLQYKKFIILFADNFGIQYGPLVASLLLYGPTLFLLGMVGPYVIRLVTHSVKTSGSSSGKVFTFSTVGSLVGVLFSGFVLVPLLPVSTIFIILSLLLVLLGAIGLFFFGKRISMKDIRSEGTFKNFLLLIVLAILLGIVGLFIKSSDEPKLTLAEHGVFGSTEIIYHDDSFYGTYEVIGLPRVKDGKLCFLIDGTNQGCVNPRESIQDSGSRYALAAAFMNHLPSGADVLVLGAGAGEYFRDWAREDINFDIVDINPNAKEVFGVTGVELDSEENSLITMDARMFLTKTDKKYDLIWNDLLGNAAPVSHMMSKEAYRLVESHLKDKGLFLNAAIGKTNGEDPFVASAYATMKEVFPSVFVTPEDEDNFFSYVLMPAFKDANVDVLDINNLFSNGWQESWGQLRYMFYEPSFRGMVITDDKNISEYLWAQNIKEFETVPSFRMKFKRLTALYFE